MTVKALYIAQWWGHLSDNKEDIHQCWGLELRYISAHICSTEEERQQRRRTRHRWKDSKGFPPKPNTSKEGNFLLLVSHLLALIFLSGCSALLALKVTKGFTLRRFTTSLALSRI